MDTHLLMIVTLLCCCTAETPTPSLERGPIEIPLLETASGHWFNQSAEPVIATQGGRLVIGAINLEMPSETAFSNLDTYGRRVALVVSPDRGDSFSPAFDPGAASNTSDPALGTADGTFFLAVLDASKPLDRAIPGFLGSSHDGTRWTWVVSTAAMAGDFWGDREAIVVGPLGVDIAAEAAFRRYSVSGALEGAVGSSIWSGGMAAGFHDSRGSFFARAGAPSVLRWDGRSAPVEEVRLSVTEDPDFAGGKSIGSDGDGRKWMLRASSSEGVVLDLWTVPDDLVELPFAGPNTFLPAGALDSKGRLHAIWYDSSGREGVLKYAHTASADIGGGFEPARTIDSDACPGGGWTPGRASGERRRLREYISLAVDDIFVHLVWTHAPSAPSRVRWMRIPL